MLLLTVVSLAPAVLMMTTCFVRIVVVLGLLRQALGTQQLPPSQVITSIALFMTLLVMSPVWNQVYSEAVVPYTAREISLEEAWTAGVKPVRQVHERADRAHRQQRRRVAVLQVPAGGHAGAGELRRRAADRAVAGVHAQRAEDRVPDRLSDLPAVSGARPGHRQRHDLDGHADAAAGADLAAVQAAAVRAGRRLAPGGRHVDGKFSNIFVSLSETLSGTVAVLDSSRMHKSRRHESANAIDLGREAVNIALLLGAPVLVCGMVVGLVVGLLQAITQIQEQTVSFVPKLVAMVIVLSLTLPWLVNEMVRYSHDLIVNIPNTL